MKKLFSLIFFVSFSFAMVVSAATRQSSSLNSGTIIIIQQNQTATGTATVGPIMVLKTELTCTYSNFDVAQLSQTPNQNTAERGTTGFKQTPIVSLTSSLNSNQMMPYTARGSFVIIKRPIIASFVSSLNTTRSIENTAGPIVVLKTLMYNSSVSMTSSAGKKIVVAFLSS